MALSLTHADAYEVLCLQAAADGRGEILFGESLARARKLARPFMVGEQFPYVYLEHPLIGDPFMDVTVLYGGMDEGQRIASDAARGAEAAIDWFARESRQCDGISFGFELDVKDPQATAAAVHFQPRRHTELVEPFCAALGEPERARLYLDLNERLPEGWALSFFGLFRGRPGSPLRVCGYINSWAASSVVEDPQRLADVFDRVGFVAYDDTMLTQIVEVLAAGTGTYDFQFDIYPDGSLGTIFAIDAQFEIEQPALVQAAFADGPAARVLGLAERWGIADERWHLGAEASFARAIPVRLDDGTIGRYSFVLMPQWAKIRWADKRLQPAKLYFMGNAGPLR